MLGNLFLSAHLQVFAAPFAYVTNQGDHTVSVVDLASHKVSATVPVGKAPVGVAIDPLSNRAYITNVESRSVSVLDMAQNKVIHEIQLGKIAPVGVVLNKSGGQLFVADWFHDQILVIETDT
ncbi:MAG: YncE family protein, partial [Methylotenera sp.]|nr:YncE family protein [Methylotenera sp.]